MFVFEASSCSTIQHLSRAAIRSGASGQDLELLASCGSDGRNPQNAERDLVSRMNRFLDLPIKPYLVDVIRHQKATGAVTMTKGAIILPHRVFAEISKMPVKFVEMFGRREQWAAYWQAHAGEEWFLRHPHRSFILDNIDKCCPFIYYGDDAQTSKRVGRTCRMSAWFSPMAEDRSGFSKIPLLFADNDERHIKAQLRFLNEAAIWSFKLAARNVNAAFDHQNGALPAWLQGFVGQPLVDGQPAYLVTSVGLKGCGDIFYFGFINSNYNRP